MDAKGDGSMYGRMVRWTEGLRRGMGIVTFICGLSNPPYPSETVSGY